MSEQINAAEKFAEQYEKIRAEIAKEMIGQAEVVEHLLLAVIAGGNVLLEGVPGLGKTHLMQAIGHFVHEKQPSARILYMTSETFTNELISAIQQKKTYEFREKIRKVDILMVDDIQFIAGREST